MKRYRLIRKFTEWRQRGRNNYYLLLFVSILVGFLTGIAAVILKNGVHYVHQLVLPIANNDKYHIGYFIFPFLGILTAYFYLKITKLEIKPGIPNLLYSISRNSGFIKPHNIYSSIVGAILTVGLGSPAGLESPNITTGGGIASFISKIFKLSYRQRILLIGIASAGTISAIFKAPITGIVFTLEVIMIDLTSLSIIPIVLASVTASLTSSMFQGTNYLYPVEISYLLNFNDLPIFLIIGIVGGATGLFFSETFKKARKTFLRMDNVFLRFLSAGFLIGILVYIFPPTFAEGYMALNHALAGDFSYLLHNDFLFKDLKNEDWLILFFLAITLAKMLTTILTVASGAIGGFFTPVLFVGANMGLFISHFLKLLNINFSHQNAALLSMSSLIAAIMHAPLTGVFFIAEITGSYALLVPLLIATSTAYIFIKFFQETNFFAEELAKKKILLTHHADHNILTMLDIKKLIETNFITIRYDKKLGDLVKAVQESKRDLFPVIDEDNNFMGIISLNRIRKIMFKPGLYEKISVKELMMFPAVTVDINEHLEDVAEKFEKTHAFNLVVLDNGKYVGFISRSNFFMHYRVLLKEFSAD